MLRGPRAITLLDGSDEEVLTVSQKALFVERMNKHTPAKRFRVAFSFAGETRRFVEKVAIILAYKFGEGAILYDKFHEAEFARYDLGIYLPKLYG